jgi:hypothetical protein
MCGGLGRLGGMRSHASGAVDVAPFERLAADRADVPAIRAPTRDVLAGRVGADNQPATAALDRARFGQC